MRRLNQVDSVSTDSLLKLVSNSGAYVILLPQPLQMLGLQVCGGWEVQDQCASNWHLVRPFLLHLHMTEERRAKRDELDVFIRQESRRQQIHSSFNTEDSCSQTLEKR
ncbi:putative protein ATXN8OS [Symphalangus syndactylus]|uniref:putative protein ATXN8OS n=1 Tax=Symphalangus syndactylus TaxID=9590 RepID=UPI0030045E75